MIQVLVFFYVDTGTRCAIVSLVTPRRGVSPMPKPEIHFSPVFGMGFWIAEDGTLISCPAFENGSFDVENAIAVDEWDDPSVYTSDHLKILAQIVQICTLKRDYVNIGYYAERFSPVA